MAAAKPAKKPAKRKTSPSRPAADRRRQFVAEYLVDLDQTAAYLRAGYRGTNLGLRVNASKMMARPDVKAAIDEALRKREARTEITADRVLKEVARLAFFDIRKLYDVDGNLKAPKDWDEETAAAVAGLETLEEFIGTGGDRKQVGQTRKAKVWDKTAALTLAMRHLGMLKDRAEISGPNGGPIKQTTVNVDMTPAEAYRATLL